MALISSHYRKPINWTDDLIIDSRKKLDRLYGALRSIDLLSEVEPSSIVLDALRDDLNTPKALSELFSIAKSINSSEDEKDRQRMASILKSSASLLGLLSSNAEDWFKTPKEKTISPETIDQLICDRELARDQKDYKKADEIRESLLESGVVIEDGPKGVLWRYNDG
jgi:cysteinyl-tRNA synthetase